MVIEMWVVFILRESICFSGQLLGKLETTSSSREPPIISFKGSNARVEVQPLEIKKQEDKKVESIKVVNLAAEKPEKIEYKIQLSESDKALLHRLDMEHRAKLTKQAELEKKLQEDQLKEQEKYNDVERVGKDRKTIEKEKICEEEQEHSAKILSSKPNPKSKLKVLDNN